MDISVIGTGYVGLVTGACFASLGHSVICVDVDSERVDCINRGVPPIYETGLEEMLKEVLERKRLRATTDLEEAVEGSAVSFISVGTPSGLLGDIDLRYIEEVGRDIGRYLPERYHVVVMKSTVVPGTTEYSLIPLIESTSGKRAGRDFGVAMNPEFLREGSAIEDFLRPDRIVIGGIDERSTETVAGLYRDFEAPIMRTDPRTAEMIKYATNSFLATKISFINEIGNICKPLGIDAYEVARGLAMDSRVSPSFLRAGIGFGGSCFPKDVKAIVGKAKEVYYHPMVLNAALELNETQPLRLIKLAEDRVGSLRGRDVVVLGLAFKPGTDDMREAPSIKIINSLLKKGAVVHAADPVATGEARKIFGDRIGYYEDPREAVKKGEILLIVTEWDEFRDEGLYRGKMVFDGRKIEEARAADYYEGVCW
ncbi:MAG: UDP-glucose/GDP-mannose dehydrogenase family protein [Methanobacteriota archaeon]|nr:MAG: UDP-glucose/GDP-mannose dehydrogenase family protein [Euryarchaeota archaeon]